jgi:hypothetical protein
MATSVNAPKVELISHTYPRHQFPVEDAPDEEIIAYRDRHFAQYSAYRNKHMQRISRNIYYDLGRQWIEEDAEITLDGARGFAFREMSQSIDTQLPRPVTNMITPAVDVEFATLAKRQWVPKVVTFSRDARAEAAARVADDILKDKLEKVGWQDQRDRFTRNLIVMGTMTIKSFWDEPYYETSWIASDSAKLCPACKGTFSTGTMPLSQEDEMMGVEPKSFGSKCPMCDQEGITDLDLDEDSSHTLDAFGRPMGQYVPKGQPNIELITPFEYYPENSGIGVEPGGEKMHGIVKVRSLDWVYERYPDLEGQIVPEPAEEMMREHPLLGEWDIVGRYDYALDAGIYDNHVRVYELYAHPSYRFPMGRSIVVVSRSQNFIVENGPLNREVSDDQGRTFSVPKTQIQSAVWKPREGEFWGKALPDDLISPQNRVNGIDAQIIEARERMGSPNLIVPEDADLQGPEFRQNYGLGKLYRYSLSPLNPQAKPEVFGSVLMPAGVNQERQSCVDDMTRIVGPSDIEVGEAPRNITTTSGLQILGEQAERRRGTRERGITTAFEKTWKHFLELIWVLRIEPDTYEMENPDGTWELKQYDRMSISGQTKVKIERQAYIDQSIFKREATREALVDQLYDPSTPLARKRLLENMGLPTDINEDSNLQIEHTKRAWADFVDEGKIPVIDPSIDNPMIRYQVFGTLLLQEEGEAMAKAAGWPQILPLIAGWEEELMRAEAADAMTREFYGGEPDPATAQTMYAQAMIQYQDEKTKWDALAARLQDTGMDAMEDPLMQQLPPPPQEPPPPIFLPKQIEHKLFGIWGQMIQKRGGPPLQQQGPVEGLSGPNDPMQALQHFMKFRAVVDGYRILSQRAAQGMPAPAAPGSTPGSAPAPAA